MSVANQKVVIITPREHNRENPYCIYDIVSLQEAMNNLKGESFKLWCYLNKNQNGYRIELSQKACEEWGIKKDAYYSGVKKLIELGYLQQTQEDNNIYIFSEKPNM